MLQTVHVTNPLFDCPSDFLILTFGVRLLLLLLLFRLLT
jgi:hypothetical protein